MKNKSIEELIEDQRYLKLLSEKYPNTSSCSTEIINLEAIMNLPKGTEHFLSDLHGEITAFTHVLKNASGVIRRKVDDIFGMTMRQSDKNALLSLIYYPSEKLALVRNQEKDIDDWYRTTLYQVVAVAKTVSSKYSHSKVRKLLPEEFAYVIEELLHEDENSVDKQSYYAQLINTIVDIGRSEKVIIAICHLIHRLVIDALHVVGDVYDRGPGACDIIVVIIILIFNGAIMIYRGWELLLATLL